MSSAFPQYDLSDRNNPLGAIQCPPQGEDCPLASEAGDLRSAAAQVVSDLSQGGCPPGGGSIGSVQQFQQAWLAANGTPDDLGLQFGQPDGVYTPSTQAAVQAVLDAMTSDPNGTRGVSLASDTAPAPCGATTGTPGAPGTYNPALGGGFGMAAMPTWIWVVGLGVVGFVLYEMMRGGRE